MKKLILILALTLTSIARAETPKTILTDSEAGYDQAAYDACMDSAEDVVSCD